MLVQYIGICNSMVTTELALQITYWKQICTKKVLRILTKVRELCDDSEQVVQTHWFLSQSGIGGSRNIERFKYILAQIIPVIWYCHQNIMNLSVIYMSTLFIERQCVWAKS